MAIGIAIVVLYQVLVVILGAAIIALPLVFWNWCLSRAFPTATPAAWTGLVQFAVALILTCLTLFGIMVVARQIGLRRETRSDEREKERS